MISKTFKFIDIYKKEFNFSVNRQDGFNTFLGGILSFFTFILIILISLFFGKNFYYRINPFLLNEIISPISYKKYRVDSKNFTLAWRIEDENGLPRNFTNKISVNLVYYEMILNETTKEFIGKSIQMPTKLCSEIDIDKNLQNTKNINDWFCLDLSDRTYFFGGFWDTDFLNYFSIDVNQFEEYYHKSNNSNYSIDSLKMNNSSINCSQNKSYTKKKDLQEFVKDNTFLSIMYPDIIFSGENLQNPLQTIYKNHFIQLSTSVVKSTSIFFSNAILEDDAGWIMEDKRIFNGMKLHEMEKNFDLFDEIGLMNGNNITLGYAVIYMKKEYFSLKRNFMKFQDMVALVGGFIKIVTMLFKAINFHFSEFSRGLFFVNFLVKDIDNLIFTKFKEKIHKNNEIFYKNYKAKLNRKENTPYKNEKRNYHIDKNNESLHFLNLPENYMSFHSGNNVIDKNKKQELYKKNKENLLKISVNQNSNLFNEENRFRSDNNDFKGETNIINNIYNANFYGHKKKKFSSDEITSRNDSPKNNINQGKFDIITDNLNNIIIEEDKECYYPQKKQIFRDSNFTLENNNEITPSRRQKTQITTVNHKKNLKENNFISNNFIRENSMKNKINSNDIFIKDKSIETENKIKQFDKKDQKLISFSNFSFKRNRPDYQNFNNNYLNFWKIFINHIMKDCFKLNSHEKFFLKAKNNIEKKFDILNYLKNIIFFDYVKRTFLSKNQISAIQYFSKINFQEKNQSNQEEIFNSKRLNENKKIKKILNRQSLIYYFNEIPNLMNGENSHLDQKIFNGIINNHNNTEKQKINFM